MVSSIIQKLSESKDLSERNLYNDSLIVALDDILQIDGVLAYDLNKLNGLSILTSKSQNIKVITWELENELEEMRYYGLILLNNDDIGMETYILQDSSSVLSNTDFKTLSSKRWYGALYYDIQEVNYKGNSYFVLLGINRRNELIKERIIEVVQNGEDPIFGQEVFDYSEKVMKKRLIYPHASNTDMSISFMEDGLIVMDHLSPSNPVYKGKAEYYVPDFSFDALQLKKGIWTYEPDFDARMDKNLKDRFYEMKLPEQKKIY